MYNGATETSKIEHLWESCKEIERENSKTPTKSLALRNQHSKETNLSKVLKISRMNAIKMRHIKKEYVNSPMSINLVTVLGRLDTWLIFGTGLTAESGISGNLNYQLN